MYKANKIFFIVFKSILLILLSYNFYYLYTYRNFKDNKNNKNIIEYTLLTSTKHSGGKGNHYSMDILYKDASHHLSLTLKEYQNLHKNEFPDVYFTKTNYSPIGLTNNTKDICMYCFFC